MRTMVGSSTYWKTRSWRILALSTCTVTFISRTSSEDVVLHTMKDGDRLEEGRQSTEAPDTERMVILVSHCYESGSLEVKGEH